MRKKIRLTVVFEPDDSGFFVFCPQLQGCYSQGRTYEEAHRNIADAIRLHMKDRRERGEPLPDEGPFTLTQLEVAV